MFSYSTGYYVSPPDDQYLKFKNRCSLMYSSTSVLARWSAGTPVFHYIYGITVQAVLYIILSYWITIFHKVNFPLKKQEQFLKDRIFFLSVSFHKQ
jgi:hypothetical protein